MSPKTEEMTDKAKETVSSISSKAQEQAEKGREGAATGLDSAADIIRSDSMPLHPEVSQKVAEGVDTAAGYLHEHSTDEMLADVERYVREHPTQSLAGAVFAGFLLGRALR